MRFVEILDFDGNPWKIDADRVLSFGPAKHEIWQGGTTFSMQGTDDEWLTSTSPEDFERIVTGALDASREVKP